jgi:GH18 family chitinase
MSPPHVNTFASNVANFIHKNNLDGVDIDWEVRHDAPFAPVNDLQI